MPDSGWRTLAAVLVWWVPATALAQSDSIHTAAEAPGHTPVTFLHDLFHLQLAGTFASASLNTEGGPPGVLGLSLSGMADRLIGLGFRQNGILYQAGELYSQGGSGEELGVRADRMAWEGEPLGFPPSGADDPALLPGPVDSAYLFPVPLFGYESNELVLWRDPTLPDSAKATARYTNGPEGFSYTGGRFRTELGAGFETDAQVYRIFSGVAGDSSGFDGHNLDMELRRQWGAFPMRLRFRQNLAHRDLLFRWQEEPNRASHNYYLTHLTFEAAKTQATSEWLLSYELRVEDQEKRTPPLLPSYQYWFDRRHRLTLSRLAMGTVAWWGAAAGGYREADSSTGLPGAFLTDVSAGARWAGRRTALLLTAGARLLQGEEANYRTAIVFRLEPARGHAFLAYAGAAREAATPLRLYLPADSGATYGESGNPGLPEASHVSTALAWRYSRPALSYDVAASMGSSTNLPVWQPSGDTSLVAYHYTPVPTDRKGASLSGHLLWRPWRMLEIEGSWRHPMVMGRTSQLAAYTPQDSWWGAVRVPISVNHVHLRITPEISTSGQNGGTLPNGWMAWSFGVDATLKTLTIFWHRDNASDELIRTGGAYPWYTSHSRFGFSWTFWN